MARLKPCPSQNRFLKLVLSTRWSWHWQKVVQQGWNLWATPHFANSCTARVHTRTLSPAWKTSRPNSRPAPPRAIPTRSGRSWSTLTTGWNSTCVPRDGNRKLARASKPSGRAAMAGNDATLRGSAGPTGYALTMRFGDAGTRRSQRRPGAVAATIRRVRHAVGGCRP